MPDHDPVNHPSHYTSYKGLEIIDLTEQMNFNRGNAVKYIARAGLKDPATEVEDLRKAAWYLQREIERVAINHVEETQGESAVELITETYVAYLCLGCGVAYNENQQECPLSHPGSHLLSKMIRIAPSQ